VKKLKILTYHFVVFVLGSIGLSAYVFKHLASQKSVAGVGGAVVAPVIAFVYIVGFGILCLISLGIFLIIAHFRHP